MISVRSVRSVRCSSRSSSFFCGRYFLTATVLFSLLILQLGTFTKFNYCIEQTLDKGHCVQLETTNFADRGESPSRVDQLASTESSATDTIKQLPPAQGDQIDESFSACIVVMDENPRLPEWLAYHYLTLPLRYLVVATDPRSTLSPKTILAKWEDESLLGRDRMTIVHMKDSDYLNFNFYKKYQNKRKRRLNSTTQSIHNILEAQLQHEQLAERQQQFFKACTRHLQDNNRTWTAFIDADEFITFDDVNNRETYKSDNGINKRLSLKTPGSILKFLERVRSKRKARYPHFQKPCITIPRQLFSAVELSSEEEEEEYVSLAIPTFVDSQQFSTLRFPCMAGSKKANGLPKSIIDVSLVPSDIKEKFNVHRPIPFLCPSKEGLGKKKRRRPLVIHHYLGSWEMYSFRNDPRKGKMRSYDKWKNMSFQREGGCTDRIRPWIQGFVHLVGEQPARVLLQGAGLPPNYTNHNQNISDWTVAM